MNEINYRLVRVDITQHSDAREVVGNDGTVSPKLLEETDTSLGYYYAIFEREGANSWNEVAYFEQDLDKAIKEYNEMIKGE